MQVKFRTNLGRIDAETLGLDFKHCCDGMTAEVSEAAGEKLTKSGIAIDVTPPAPPKSEKVHDDKPAPRVHQPAAESTKPGK